MMPAGTDELRGVGMGATYGTYGASGIAVSPFRLFAGSGLLDRPKLNALYGVQFF
jgi:hypothetical protein